jgi:hypothetical protein
LSFDEFAIDVFGNALDELELKSGFSRKLFLRSVWRYALVTSAIVAFLDFARGRSRDQLDACAQLIHEPGDLPNCLSRRTRRFSLYNTFINATKSIEPVLTGDYDPDAKATFPLTPRFVGVERAFMECLGDDASILVTVDDFDKAYERFHDVVQPHIHGLLSAVRQLRDVYANAAVFQIKAFVPKDAVTPQQYRDMDKILVETVEWSANELRVMLAKRIHRTIRNTHGGVPRNVESLDAANAVLGKIFPTTFTGPPGFNDAFAWMFHFTQARPRDVLFLVRELIALKTSEEERAQALTEADIFQFLPAASVRLAETVIAEYNARFPGLDSVIQCFASGSASIQRDEALHRVSRLRQGKMDAQAWLDALYEIGVLGRVLLVPMPGNVTYTKKRAVFSFHDDTSDPILSPELVVHQMFWRKLQLVPPDWPFLYADTD